MHTSSLEWSERASAPNCEPWRGTKPPLKPKRARDAANHLSRFLSLMPSSQTTPTHDEGRPIWKFSVPAGAWPPQSS
eukprot:13983068-Alexandrium_andersonii.AAC.1